MQECTIFRKPASIYTLDDISGFANCHGIIRDVRKSWQSPKKVTLDWWEFLLVRRVRSHWLIQKGFDGLLLLVISIRNLISHPRNLCCTYHIANRIKQPCIGFRNDNSRYSVSAAGRCQIMDKFVWSQSPEEDNEYVEAGNARPKMWMLIQSPGVTSNLCGLVSKSLNWLAWVVDNVNKWADATATATPSIIDDAGKETVGSSFIISNQYWRRWNTHKRQGNSMPLDSADGRNEL
jgi:hypothetical protein